MAVTPHVEQARTNKGVIDPAMDHNARIHDHNLFKSLLDALTGFTINKSRLISIIRNRKHLVNARTWDSRTHA